MIRTAAQLRADALTIWQAGVEAVLPSRLVPEYVNVEDGWLALGDEAITLDDVRRIAVVGAGKASGAMAAALEAALGVDVLRAKLAASCVNVPEGARPATELIDVSEVRPAGANEPTAAAAAGAEEMLRIVGALGPDDLCLCLISGGGSALLPAPVDGITLGDKLELTRALSAGGATIHELNSVRRALSRVKGGGLARACGAGRLAALILSDVPGDDLATIASGPTVMDGGERGDAADVLRRYGLDGTAAGVRALEVVERLRRAENPAAKCRVTNVLIGNNATAVDGAGVAAERLGYSHAMISAREPEGDVRGVAGRLVDMAVHMRSHEGPDCLISGGEPTVTLAPPELRGMGGRNQQLCLEARAMLDDWRGLALVSGGSDGEDGPTDAAGALIDEVIVARAAGAGLTSADATEALARNDAYRYFERCGGLLITGATHTNVGDLRVITVSR
jgi:glycerate 2-kinase